MSTTPAEHREKAAALMARVDEMKNAALPISVALTAQAHVHALLAMCDEHDYRHDDYWSGHLPTRGLETRRAKRDLL